MIRKAIFLFLFLLSSISITRAQWEKLPLYGGHAEKLVRSIFNPNEIFALTKGAGVWYSSDAGNNWKPINGNDNYLVGKTLDDIAVTKSHSYFIFIEKELFRSNDSGSTWIHQQIPFSNLMIDVDSKSYICMDGTIFMEYYNYITHRVTLIKSIDDGLTWIEMTQPKDIGSSYINVYLDVNNSSLIFLSAYYGTFAKSTDQGKTWTYPNEFLGNFVNCPPVKIFNPSDNIFGVATSLDVGLPFDFYISRDTGSSWIKMDTIPIPYKLENPIYTSSSGTLISRVGTRLVSSSDTGKTWSQLSDSDGITDILLKNDTILASFRIKGIAQSTDEGASWTPAVSMKDFCACSSVEIGSADNGILFALAQDDIPGLYQSTDGGDTWKLLFTSNTLANLQVVKQPEIRWYGVSNSDKIITGTINQTIPDTLLARTWASVESFAVSRAAQGVLYFYSRGSIFSSTDGGKNWKSNPGPPFAFRHFYIYPSNKYPGTFVGLSEPMFSEPLTGMGIWKSSDFGYSGVLTHADEDAYAYVVLFGSDLLFDPRTFGISKDYGYSWTSFYDGMKDEDKGRAYKYFVCKGTLIIASDSVWYQYKNDSWVRMLMNDGTPVIREIPADILDLEIGDNQLYAFFGSNGLYRLKNSTVTDNELVSQATIPNTEFSAFPNPFHDKLEIKVQGRGNAAYITICDLLGRTVESFHVLAQSGEAASFIWDGRTTTGLEAAPGLYRIALLAGSTVRVQTVMKY